MWISPTTSCYFMANCHIYINCHCTLLYSIYYAQLAALKFNNIHDDVCSDDVQQSCPRLLYIMDAQWGYVMCRFSLSVSLLDSQPWLAGYSNAGLHIGCAWDKSLKTHCSIVFLCLAANEQLRQLPAVKSKQAFISIHLSPDTYLSCLSACWLFPFHSLTRLPVTINAKLCSSFAFHSKCYMYVDIPRCLCTGLILAVGLNSSTTIDCTYLYKPLLTLPPRFLCG